MVKNFLKRLILGKGRAGRRIPVGLYKGLTLSIDPATESNFYFGLYERETAPLLRKAGRVARSLIDVGAGCGELTVWGLSHPNIERVLAYDSSPERWPIFFENLRLNGVSGDDRLQAEQAMFLGRNKTDVAEEVLGELPEPILFRIDVDGGEQEIIESMLSVLRRKRSLLLIETHSRELDQGCFTLLSNLGYNVTRIAPAWWRKIIPEQRPLGFNRWLWAER